MSGIDKITKEFTNKKIPKFKSGDTVRVFLKIREGEKERIQYYEGVVIAIHNNGISSTFKVRKESYGVGVERTFPLFSPLIQKIEVKRRGDVRRAKLYYLRKLTGKKARVKEKKDWMIKKSQVEAEEEEILMSEAGIPPVGEPAADTSQAAAPEDEKRELEPEAAQDAGAAEETAHVPSPGVEEAPDGEAVAPGPEGETAPDEAEPVKEEPSAEKGADTGAGEETPLVTPPAKKGKGKKGENS